MKKYIQLPPRNVRRYKGNVGIGEFHNPLRCMEALAFKRNYVIEISKLIYLVLTEHIKDGP